MMAASLPVEELAAALADVFRKTPVVAEPKRLLNRPYTQLSPAGISASKQYMFELSKPPQVLSRPLLTVLRVAPLFCIWFSLEQTKTVTGTGTLKFEPPKPPEHAPGPQRRPSQNRITCVYPSFLRSLRNDDENWQSPRSNIIWLLPIELMSSSCWSEPSRVMSLVVSPELVGAGVGRGLGAGVCSPLRQS